MSSDEQLEPLVENVRASLAARIRDVLEFIILMSSIAFLGLYLISASGLSPYLYIVLYLFYLAAGYDIWRALMLHRRYSRLLSLTEAGSVERLGKRFRLVNLVVLAFNAVFAVLILFRLVYLTPLLVSLVLYMYSRVDEEIVGAKEALAAALLNVALSAVAFLDPGGSYVIVAVADLADLAVMKVVD